MYTILYPELEPRLYNYQVAPRAQDPAQSLAVTDVRIPVAPAPGLTHTVQTAEGLATTVCTNHPEPVPVLSRVPGLVWQALAVIALNARTRWIRLT
jgi:hypothetical protein